MDWIPVLSQHHFFLTHAPIYQVLRVATSLTEGNRKEPHPRRKEPREFGWDRTGRNCANSQISLNHFGLDSNQPQPTPTIWALRGLFRWGFYLTGSPETTRPWALDGAFSHSLTCMEGRGSLRFVAHGQNMGAPSKCRVSW